MDNMNLYCKQEYRGYWYLPSEPEQKVAGIVTYYPNEKIILELIGAFNEEIEALFSEKEEPVIHGITSDAKNISLIRCYQYTSVNFGSGIPIVRYLCEYMIVGKHLMSLEERCQYWSYFRIPELSLWCHPAAIGTEACFNDAKKQISHIHLFFTTDPSSEERTISAVDVDENTTIVLKKGIDYKESLLRLKPQLEQYTYVEILKKEKSSIFDHFSDVHVFEEFLSLATMTSVSHSSVTIFDAQLYQPVGDKKYYTPIHVFHTFANEERDITNDKIPKFLFEYSRIKDTYPMAIKAWYGFSLEIRPIISHLIESLKKRRVYSSVDFLIIVQAIEGFWWRFKDDSYHNQNNIPRRCQTNLKTIFSELVTEFGDIKLIKNAQINIDAIVDSRHYYSHFVPRSKKPKTLDGFELLNEARKIRVILICCVLSYIGFDNLQIDNILNTSNINFYSKDI